MITAELRFAARSAYRELLRAASTTFAGDLHILNGKLLLASFKKDPHHWLSFSRKNQSGRPCLPI